VSKRTGPPRLVGVRKREQINVGTSRQEWVTKRIRSKKRIWKGHVWSKNHQGPAWAADGLITVGEGLNEGEKPENLPGKNVRREKGAWSIMET